MSIQAEFQRLSMSEQIEMVQKLWDQIAAAPEDALAPDWHRFEMAKREREWANSPDLGEDWAVVKARLRESL